MPDHYRKVPKFAELKFVDIPEESTRIANFLTGKIDVWRAEQDSIAIVAENTDTKFMSQGGAGTMYLLFWQNGLRGDNLPDEVDPISWTGLVQN